MSPWLAGWRQLDILLPVLWLWPPPPPLGWWGSDAFCAQGTKEKKPSCCGCCQQTPAEQGS